jgi:hypothetical protein
MKVVQGRDFIAYLRQQGFEKGHDYGTLKATKPISVPLMPHLHLQLFDQLRQWITPADQRHLSGFAEIMAAILLSQSACLSRWIPNLSHRDCSARSHLERLSYFVHNPRITASIFYEPLLRHVLEPLSGSALDLTLDTSVFWDEFCLIECL